MNAQAVMIPKYCENCKSTTTHYKDMCTKCGKRPKTPDFGDVFSSLMGNKK